jgi:hypothetical protein
MSGANLPCVLRATAPFVYVRLHGPDEHHLYAGPTPMPICNGGPGAFANGRRTAKKCGPTSTTIPMGTRCATRVLSKCFWRIGAIAPVSARVMLRQHRTCVLQSEDCMWQSKSLSKEVMSFLAVLRMTNASVDSYCA